MQKVCQSCGMPLKQGQGDFRGTEADGTRSEKYCTRCYLQGKYVDPNLTKEQLINITFEELDKSDMNKIKKWMLKKVYPKQLNALERWRR